MIVSFKYSSVVGYIDIRVGSGKYNQLTGWDPSVYQDTRSHLLYTEKEIDKINKDGWVITQDRSGNVIHTIESSRSNFSTKDYQSAIYSEFIEEYLPTVIKNHRSMQMGELGI
jgi:hypothetical protein